MSKKWIGVSKVEGISSRQAHADLPKNTFERELGKEGFFGPATHMHHQRPPTSWVKFEGPLKPRAFDTTQFHAFGESPWDAPLLLSNVHCKYRQWTMTSSMDHLVRNSDGDELLFIHTGAADLYTDYGHLAVRDGDYVVIPRGTMWRLASESPIQMLLIEATNSSYQLPEKGLVGPHAIFDEAMLDAPALNDTFKAQQIGTEVGDKEWKIVVKRRNELTTITYPYNPLDATGWHGNLMPVRINWRDIRPLMSHRFHLPPSAHTTFVANRFVVCTFVPRPFETDEGALKVPFYHNNDDYDELIFYHKGEFFSRDNIHPGMITLHPCGFTHGPHPGAMKNAYKPATTGTNEVAVMIDTRDALDVSEDAEKVEWLGYVDSWKPK